MVQTLWRFLTLSAAVAILITMAGSRHGASAQEATPAAEPVAFECVTDFGGQPHPFGFPQPDDRSEGFYAVIEIPQDSNIKYEIHDTGYVFVDRFISMPVRYPGNYGSIPSSAGGDGDPLDVIVLTREPIQAGALIMVRPIGIILMLDGGEVDDKVIAVPVSGVDPTYDGIASVSDLADMDRERIVQFFEVYKFLPEDTDEIEILGFEEVEAAETAVSESLDRYAATCNR